MYRVCLLVLLGVWHASAQITTPAPGSSVDCNTVGIQNCGKCDVPGMTCAFCADNYVLASDYKSCIACDENCVDCVLDTTGKLGMCQQCDLGFVVKADGTCGQCESFCAVCQYTDATQSATVCTQCFPPPAAYPYPYLLGAYSKQCQDCTTISAGCQTCTEAADKSQSCTGCQPGFVAVSSGSAKTCTSCPSYCSSCSLAKGAVTVSTCNTCVANYVPNLAASPTYACLYCDPTKCAKCSTTAVNALPSLAQCSTCQKGYYLDSNSMCQSCPAGCATCTSASACQSCVTSGFWFDSTNAKCTPCSIGCNTCSFSAGQETCTACSSGYGLQSSQVSCQECPDFCTDCSDPATCTTCVVATVANPEEYITVVAVDGTFCMLCPDNCATCVDNGDGDTACSQCDNGYQAATDKNGDSFCFPCPSHCLTCTIDPNTFAATCTACMPDSKNNDYYLNTANNCVSCAAQCTNCGGTSTCGGCQPGYFLDTTGTTPKCTGCPSNCLSCSDASTCNAASCATGYYVDATSHCTKCSTNCVTCTSPTICSACVTGFYVDGNTACTACDAKCQSGQCAATGGVCGQCNAGYMPDGNSGATCIKCDANCDTANGGCTITGTTPSCTACVDGYYVNANSGCTKCSVTGCKTCTANPTCTVCLPTYTSNGAATIACLANDPHCASGSGGLDSTGKKTICTSCVTGYTANTPGACILNPAGCDVGMVNPADTTGATLVCQICSSGYGLNSKSLCDPCPANCVSCSPDVNGIQQCDAGACDTSYAENLFACGLCPVGCTTCRNINGEMFCSQCSSQGYYLDSKNGICIDCTLCSSCSASGCNPGSCVDGYGLASDLTCTDCSDLTGVSGCSNCTDADATGNAKCLDCDEGQVLDGWGANCVDASPLTNCDEPEFRPYECTPGSCNSPYSWVTEGPGRGQCGLVCAICGDIDSGLYLSADQCQNSNNNYTEALVVGACWVSQTTDSNGVMLYARGGTKQYNCTADAKFEFASSTNAKVTFKCCDSGNGCSDSITLDGVAGASATSFSLALLFASILAALRLF